MENESVNEPPVEQVDPGVNLEYISQQSNPTSSPNKFPLPLIIGGVVVLFLFLLIILVSLISGGSKKNTQVKISPTVKQTAKITPKTVTPTEEVSEPTITKTKVIQELVVDNDSKGIVLSPTVKIEKIMTLTSSAFKNNELLPQEYSCNGEDINPPLAIGNIPAETKSLAIIVKDLDANNFAHWLVWNLSPTTKEIPQGAVLKEAMEGLNDFEEPGYKGPCPPQKETHSYVFTVYALKSELILDAQSKLKDLEGIISNKIITKAELIGKYRVE